MAKEKAAASANGAAPKKSDAAKDARARMKSKYPDLFPNLEKLEREIDTIEKRTAPLRAKMEKIQEKLQPLLAEERELAEQINKIERPALGEKKTALAALHRAMGAVTVSANSSDSDE